MSRPDPFAEIRLTALRSLRGANFWSRSPVTRLDLQVGVYDDISSAEVPGLTDALVAALPGLVEHRCSVGERGGFVARLRQGTYAPHIVEHLALELQAMIGHEVGFGRARGAGHPGEYTVVFAHRHAEVGLRAAAHALSLIQQAFAERDLAVEPALAELRALAAAPDLPPPRAHVLCGVTGGGPRAEVCDALARRYPRRGPAVDVAPAYLLDAGLPYARSELAIILDAAPIDVPHRYREPERARQLVGVLADAVPEGGIVIVPAHERALQARVREAGRRVALFASACGVPRGMEPCAAALAYIRQERIVIERGGAARDAGAVERDRPHAAQLATALADALLQDLHPDPVPPEGSHA